MNMRSCFLLRIRLFCTAGMRSTRGCVEQAKLSSPSKLFSAFTHGLVRRDMRRDSNIRIILCIQAAMKGGICSILPLFFGLLANFFASAYSDGWISPVNINGYRLSRPTTGIYGQQEPIYIQITNVVSPQVTSNSNAISNASSIPGFAGSPGPGMTDLHKILFLSGTQLIPYQGSPTDVKVVYVPVLVPVNATTGSTVPPSNTADPGPSDSPMRFGSGSPNGKLVDTGHVELQDTRTTKNKAWKFPSK